MSIIVGVYSYYIDGKENSDRHAILNKTLGWIIGITLINFNNWLILIGGLMILTIVLKVKESEWVFLVLINILGIIIMINSKEILSFYLSIEIQSLSTVLLISYKYKKEGKRIEATLKYFFLSGLNSCIILLGLIQIWMNTGLDNWIELEIYLDIEKWETIGFKVLIFGLFFKLGAAPLHYWIVDVYEAAQKWIVKFLATIPKVAVIQFLSMRMMILYAHWNVIYGQTFYWIGMIISLWSSVIGAIQGLNQRNLWRLMGYSTIMNNGFIILGIYCFNWVNNLNNEILTLYMGVYAITIIGIFYILMWYNIEKLEDLLRLNTYREIEKITLTILLFSLIGIPPLLGFFSKALIMVTAIESNMYWFLCWILVTSVISSYYYLRIIEQLTLDNRGWTEFNKFSSLKKGGILKLGKQEKWTIKILMSQIRLKNKYELEVIWLSQILFFTIFGWILI
uniref:NADH dehydrogenase subunit 2 n=1 Tax=Ministeria vibrans TaxID=134558 RepID=M1K523_MINVI|nr:NADH dehydrogenase subunit 2 [Ministeria vibrans]AGE93709.1 NADH dehydrogenase subunit 2 [Ministeria vibrans]